MSFLAVVDACAIDIFAFMTCTDLLRIELADSVLRNTTSGASLGQASFNYELESFELSRKLWNTKCHDSEPASFWRELKQVVATLRGVHVIAPQPMLIEELGFVRKLTIAVRRANGDAAGRVDASADGAARMLVGHFKFPNVLQGQPVTRASKKAMLAIAAASGRRQLGEDAAHPWVSDALTFNLAYAGAGEGQIALRLAWKQDRAALAAYHFAGHKDVSNCISVDLCALDPEMMLRSKGTSLTIDGPWSRVSGVSTTLAPKPAFCNALERGVSCLICIRLVTTKGAAGVSKRVHALHLDA